MRNHPPSTERPHRRYNPLTGEWVLVSPHRGKRPWLGAEEHLASETRHLYDDSCALCPGNERAGGAKNPEFKGPFVFQNDFPALLNGTDPDGSDAPFDPLFQHQEVSGEARVICFSEKHDVSLARMSTSEIRAVVATWKVQARELAQRYENVLIFENKGEAMGCSNPHPHGQIWATDYLPAEIAKEDLSQRAFLEANRRPLLADYVEKELALAERIVFQTKHWVSLVPFWAVWPFETLLLPITPIQRFDDMREELADDLSVALKKQTTLYDNLFKTDFPYSMGWHAAPGSGRPAPHWVLHAHFYPPLLRSATIRKFMVGFELLGEPQRDLTPEKAASMLRAQTDQHYLETGNIS